MRKLRITIDLDLTAEGTLNMSRDNNASAHALANTLRDALSKDKKHIRGVAINIEARR